MPLKMKRFLRAAAPIRVFLRSGTCSRVVPSHSVTFLLRAFGSEKNSRAVM